MGLKMKVFTVLILSVIVIMPSCKMHKEKTENSKIDSNQESSSVKFPYNSMKLIDCTDILIDFTQLEPKFADQEVTNKVYQLMRPSSWKEIPNYEKTNQGMSLQFNKSTDKVDYCYEIYANGQIFYHSKIPGTAAKKASNGEYVTGDYAFYQAPSNIYTDLVNYLRPLAK